MTASQRAAKVAYSFLAWIDTSTVGPRTAARLPMILTLECLRWKSNALLGVDALFTPMATLAASLAPTSASGTAGRQRRAGLMQAEIPGRFPQRAQRRF